MTPVEGNNREEPPARLFGGPSGDVAVAVAVAFVGFLLLTIGFRALGSSSSWSRAADQPVQFNHRLHIEDVGLECSECHAFAESEAFSGFPTAETCSFCHEEAQGANPEETKLVSLLSEGRPLEWGRLFQQPSHVYYSHSRHVSVAGLECERCHAGIASSTRPPRRVRRLTMDDCIDCHHENEAEADCTTCHR